jgi:hypothetical protein
MPNPIEMGYITVAERLAAFTKEHPKGRIATQLVSITDTMAVVAAQVWKIRSDDAGIPPDGTGLSSMPIPGPTSFTKNSEVENAETSAIGRALAAIGYLAKTEDGKPRISSQEEITAKSGDDPEITQKQRGLLFKLAKESGIDPDSGPGKGAMRKVIKDVTGKTSSKELVNSDMDKLVAHFTAAAVARATGGEVVE